MDESEMDKDKMNKNGREPVHEPLTGFRESRDELAGAEPDSILLRGFMGVVNKIADFTTKPYFCSSSGIFLSGLNTMGSLANGDGLESLSKLSAVPVFIAMDGARAGIKYGLEKVFSSRSAIEQVYPPTYFSLMGNVVADDKGIKGKLDHARTSLLEPSGTSILGGGYFTKIEFFYGDGSEASAIMKAGSDNKTRRGGEISDKLSRTYDFVPKTISVSPYVVKPFISTSRFQEPVVFDFVEGNSLEHVINGEDARRDSYDEIFDGLPIGRIFDTMFEIYDGEKDTSTRKFKFTEDLGENLSRKGSNSFWDKYRSLRDSEFDGAPLTLIHTDFHQGNVMSGDFDHVIDWDSASRGIPYQDFTHFAMISDLDKCANYSELRGGFLSKQEEILPGITDEQLALTDFETALGLMNRYSRAANNGVRTEFKENMFKSSRYLLERAKGALSEYATLAGDDSIEDEFELFVKGSKTFRKVDRAEYDGGASIAYAHMVNQKHTKKDIGELPMANIEKDRVLSERSYRDNNGTMVNHIANMGTLAAMVGVCAISDPNELVEAVNGDPLTVYGTMIGGVGALYSHKIYNAGVGLLKRFNVIK